MGDPLHTYLYIVLCYTLSVLLILQDFSTLLRRTGPTTLAQREHLRAHQELLRAACAPRARSAQRSTGPRHAAHVGFRSDPERQLVQLVSLRILILLSLFLWIPYIWFVVLLKPCCLPDMPRRN